MQNDMAKLLKDKRLWVGGAVAAAIGLVVFVKRGAGASTMDAVTGGTASGPGGTYVQGAGDTTGTDIAGYLGNYQQSLSDMLAGWGGSLNDTLKAIQDGAGANPWDNQFSFDPEKPHSTGVLGDT